MSKTIYAILMREVNKSTGEIYVKVCEKGTQKFIQKRIHIPKIRSLFNEDLTFYLCLQEKEKEAMKLLRKKHINENSDLYEKIGR